MFAKSVALVSLLIATVSVAGLSIDTPKELVECQEVKISYREGAPKYLLAVVPGKEPCADALYEFDETSNTEQTWKVTAKAGTEIIFVVEDSAATEAWTGSLVVKAGSDKSCLPAETAPPPASSTTFSSSTAPSPTPTSYKAPVAPKPATPEPGTNGLANVASDNSTSESKAASARSTIALTSATLIGAFVGVLALLS